MRIPVRLIIEVDPDAWAASNGQVADSEGRHLSARAVVEDVKSYILNLVQQAPMVDETDAEVTWAAR